MTRMKRIIVILTVVALLALSASVVLADKPVATNESGEEVAWEAGVNQCTKIQDGVLTYAAAHYLHGQPLEVGFDVYGYNYQAHMFKGTYANSYLGGQGYPVYTGDDAAYVAANPTVVSKWYWPYRDVYLEMKWSDSWISNVDCGLDGVSGPKDGKLDRHFGFATYRGSEAWLTNHQKGVNDDGSLWIYFTKIIAAPAEANLNGGIWYTAAGSVIGPYIWADFATIMDVTNDPMYDLHGVQYVSPDHAGFGGW